MSAPERIWAAKDRKADVWDAGTFCSVDDGGTEYVRADLLAAAQAEIARLKAENAALADQAIKDRKAANAAMSDALMWQFSVADGSHDGQPLLLRVWQQRQSAERRAVAAEARAERAEAERDAAMAERAEPVAWLPDVAYSWLISYDGTACARMTAIYRAPLKDGSGIPLYTTPQPAPTPQAREITVQEAARVLEVKALIEAAWCAGRDAAATAAFGARPLSISLLEAIGALTPPEDLRAIADMQKGG